MVFGLSLGAKTSSQNSTSTVDKTETTNQTQTGTKSQTGSSTQNSSQQQTGSSAAQQSGTQAGSNKTSGTSAATTTSTTNAFSDSTLKAIESAVSQLFGTVGAKAPISAFDAKSFIDSGLSSAKADINSQLESNLNQLTTNIGGSAGTNTMSALLANKLRSDAAAKTAGVQADLTAQAETILRDNALASSQIAATDQGFLTQLLGALKGGTVTTTGAQQTQTAQDQQTQATTAEQNAQQTAANTSAQQTQTQQLIEQLSQLLNGTTNTKGIENTNTKNTSMGGGFSLGF